MEQKKYLLSYHVTNNKLKNIVYYKYIKYISKSIIKMKSIDEVKEVNFKNRTFITCFGLWNFVQEFDWC